METNSNNSDKVGGGVWGMVYWRGRAVFLLTIKGITLCNLSVENMEV